METFLPDGKTLSDAASLIAPFIHKTPVLQSTFINELSGANLFFKCENFQKIGAFKARGAIHAALNLSTEDLANGLATHSSGNHAQAVALAAKIAGTKAYIVMPENAPKIKVQAVKSLGAKVFFCASNIAAREEKIKEVITSTSAYFIHPYNNKDVILGQSSCAQELINDFSSLDIIICPVGGGGLLAGTLLATHRFSPNTKVFAAEPALVDDAYRSMKSGKIEAATNLPTIADGLKTNLGRLNFDIMKQLLSDIFLVSESEIIAAMRIIWERLKIIVEPSCAVPLAAILKNKNVFKEKQVGVILTGGNVDLDNLPF